jgi:hypothetical protein
MSHDTTTKIAHAIHAVHNTEIGKKAIHTVGTGAVAVATAVLGPAVVAVAAPVAIVAAIGWGIWSVFKE